MVSSRSDLGSTSHLVLSFTVSEQSLALPLKDVHEVLLIPELVSCPGKLQFLEGLMNLAGTVVPVVRLSRLLSLPDREVGPYDHVIVLRQNYALLVECVTGLVYLDQVELMPVPSEVSFNECVTNCIRTSGSTISLLSESQLMLREERLRLKEVRDKHQSRLAAVGEQD